MLVDVRQPKEYAENHLPGAILIPLKELEARIAELKAERDIIFYCRTGRRSRVAAMFAAGTGINFKTIYNLEGGIRAWNGTKVDDMPSFSILKDATSISSLLKLAINLEKGAENFYKICAEKWHGTTTGNLAAVLAKLEQGHARVIYGILKKSGEDIPEFEKMYHNMKGDILEGGITIQDAIDRISSIEDNTCINFMEMALDIEYRAYDLYKSLSGQTSDTEMQHMLLQLADQEKSHIRIVAGGIAQCFDES
jgi:rhodanese-related sulfurtransferase/rubrerythrin